MAKALFRKHLIHKCTIQRNTPSQSGSGELIDSFATIATGRPCRFIAKSERIADEAVSFQMLESYLLLMDTGEDVAKDDRITDIVWKSDNTSVDDGPFTIEELLNRNSTRAHHISLQLERVE